MTAFLVNYFRKYVEYDFTADLENQLDEVSAGDRAYKDVLDAFWRDFSAAISETSELRITDVLEKINEVAGAATFFRFIPIPDKVFRLTCACGALRTAAGAAVKMQPRLQSRRRLHRLLELRLSECRFTFRPFGLRSQTPRARTARRSGTDRQDAWGRRLRHRSNSVTLLRPAFRPLYVQLDAR